MQAYDRHTFQPTAGPLSGQQEIQRSAISDMDAGGEGGELRSDHAQKRRKGSERVSSCEVVEIFDEDEGGSHRPSTPIVISSSSDDDPDYEVWGQ